MYRYRELLTSFLASAMLTTALAPVPGTLMSQASVVNAEAAQRALALAMEHAPAGFSGASVASVTPAPVAPTLISNTDPIITRARMSAIYTVTRTRESTKPIGQPVSVPLGLTVSGVEYITKQTHFYTLNPEIKHYFAVDVGDGQKVLLMRQDGRNLDMWVCDMDANLLSTGQIINGQLSFPPVGGMRAGFEAELRLWAARDLTAPERPVVASAQPGA